MPAAKKKKKKECQLQTDILVTGKEVKEASNSLSSLLDTEEGYLGGVRVQWGRNEKPSVRA